MTRARTLFSLAAVTLLASACANRPHDSAAGPGGGTTTDPEQGLQAEAEAEAGDEMQAAVALATAHPDAPTIEVVPDPHGRAALTLDESGGVHLYADLASDSIGAPLSLPVQDPVWMSLGDRRGGFVAAFIDTAGGGQVARIDTSTGKPRLLSLFRIPPTDPLLEMHVLRGGTRILALGVDHRLRLYDERGRVRADLDATGFVPWQLRIARPDAKDPVVLAVLAGPTRVQRIELDGDRLERVGDAIPVALDRGPNRNDLELSPDGTTVLALMRRTPRSARFELEAIDLATGTRTIVAAESDVKLRPRVHALGGGKVLLETGSGRGLGLDVAAVGTPWPPRDGTPDRDALPLVTLSGEDLPRSTKDGRMRATVVAGTRLAPTGSGLVIDPVAPGKDGRVIEASETLAHAVALDATGERVAWSTEDAIAIRTRGGEPVPHRVPMPEGGARLLAFVGAEGLVVLDAKGQATLHRIGDGETLASTSIPVSWGMATAGFRPSESGEGGQLVVSSMDPREPVHVLSVTDGGFGEMTSVNKKDRLAWPEAGKPRGLASTDFLAALGLARAELGLRSAKVIFADPDPAGTTMAIAQRTSSEDGFFDEDGDRFVPGPEHFVVTVIDRTAARRVWTFATTELRDIAWSGDGRSIAIASADGATVLDAAHGDTLLAEHTTVRLHREGTTLATR